jgi:hypothetical protein
LEADRSPLNRVTLLLRRQNVQDRVEGRAPFGWKDDDYAVLDDETVIGRMYREQLPAGLKWRWFIHVMGTSPNSGIADTLDEAKAEIGAAYERARGQPK